MSSFHVASIIIAVVIILQFGFVSILLSLVCKNLENLYMHITNKPPKKLPKVKITKNRVYSPSKDAKKILNGETESMYGFE